jgi:predicted NodU family carbamoyl transferase
VLEITYKKGLCFPIVYSPADAIDVLCKSGLEHLALNNFIISKKNSDGHA